MKRFQYKLSMMMQHNFGVLVNEVRGPQQSYESIKV